MPKTLETLTATTAPALNSKMLIRRSGQTSDESVLVSYLKTLINTSVAVSGGTIDNAVIGGTTPAAATVTDLTATGTTTLATALTGILKASSGVISAGNVDLAAEVTGVLPVANGGTGASTASGARTNLGLGSAAEEDTSAFLQPANNLNDVSSASSARTNLGLGSISTQASSNVSITGGSITDLSALDMLAAGDATFTVESTGGVPGLHLRRGTIDWQLYNKTTGLEFTYESVQKFLLNSDGDLTVAGDFEASGTLTSASVSITGGSITGITDLAVADGGTGASDAGGARTNLGLGTIATQDANNVSVTGGSITGITDLAVADGGTGSSTAGGARTNLGLGTIATQDANNVSISGGSVTGISDIAVADGGTGSSTASGARTNLGLGSISTQASNNVSITGGSVTGITDLAVADGGTGASDAATARTNLGLGSAATLTAGTSANNAVQLDGSAKLPAIDGSQLTNLPGSSPVTAWVNFDGTGTVAINDDLNVASITDNGNGDYTVNFDTAMSNANYAAVTTAQRVSGTSENVTTIHQTGYGTSGFRTITTTLTDSPIFNVIVTGGV